MLKRPSPEWSSLEMVDLAAAHQARRAAAAAAISPDLGALLITSIQNVRYLTGFAGSHGAVLLESDGRAWLATDGRYLERAATEASAVECVEARRAGPELVVRAVQRGIARLGFEPGAVTVESYDALRAAAGEALELVRAPKDVEALRVVKDAAELAVLAEACRITAEAFHHVVGQLRQGATEKEVSWLLSAAMRERGADGDAFSSIVAFGSHSAIPHHEAGERPLARGDLVKLDFGASLAGYRADMTRTVVLGPAADWQRELHGEVAAVQADLRDAAVPGAVPRDLDAAMRRDLERLGHHPLHGLGHGVGLAIHEDPFLTENSPAPALAPGTPVTIEPGIYLAGRGGVRIEDTVVVEASGGPRVLTNASRELIEC